MNKQYSICHITSAHERFDTRIFQKQCRSLARNGYQTTLLVNDRKEDTIVDGVKIISTQCQPTSRLQRFIVSRSKLIKKAIDINADIYHLHDPDLLPVGRKLKKINKLVIFDSHEDIPLQIHDKQWIPFFLRKVIAKLYRYYEKKTLAKFDALISVTPHIVERLKTINALTILITNYPIASNYEAIAKKPENAICFAGGITEQYNHVNVLKSIEQIDDIKYILAGSINNNYHKKLTSLPSWEKVEYLGKIAHENVKEVYARSNMGVIILKSTQTQNKGTIGNIKLFEMMGAELPVVCSNYPLWEEIIRKYQCGVCVDPDNIEEIANAIKYILQHPQEATKMGLNARKAIEQEYNWKSQEECLLKLYQRIL